MKSATRIVILGSLLLALIGVYYFLSQYGALTFLGNSEALTQWIQQLGLVGPLVIIGLMIVAIIMSPIPSAPIALVAGAVYGHTAGTVYVAIGAELGAIIAFFIARVAGIDFLQKWVGDGITKRMLGSQNTLMGIVFLSRLLPFVSFDMVSYAAGITPITFWRFAIATLAGIIPASFLLAHFGSELTSGEDQRIGITLLILGSVSVVILITNWIKNR